MRQACLKSIQVPASAPRVRCCCSEAAGTDSASPHLLSCALPTANLGGAKRVCNISLPLQALRCEYLDLYLIHWPVTGSVGPELRPSVRETWQAMEGLVREGLVRSIGVSNFGARKLQDILGYAEIPPAVCQVRGKNTELGQSQPRPGWLHLNPGLSSKEGSCDKAGTGGLATANGCLHPPPPHRRPLLLLCLLQVEVHPYHRNDALIAFCRAASIHVTAFSPLGSPDSASIFPRKKPLVLMEDETVRVCLLTFLPTADPLPSTIFQPSCQVWQSLPHGFIVTCFSAACQASTLALYPPRLLAEAPLCPILPHRQLPSGPARMWGRC